MSENKRFERIYADVDVFCRDHNAKGASQLIEREDYDKIVDLLNELAEENKQLKFENNELKCALSLDAVDYIIADGKKIDIPPYYEFEQRYDHIIHRKEYDGYD